MSDIIITLAKDCAQPQAACAEAFGLHTRVREGIATPLPVLLLPKTASDFNAENTLVALRDGRLIGTALLSALPPQGTDLSPVAAKFGELAVQVMGRHLGQRQFELGSIAVCPDSRCRGVGAAFYRTARTLTQDRCLAVINLANGPSQHAAATAGYTAAAGDVHVVNFRLEGKTPVPDPRGRHAQTANVFVPGR